MNAPSAPAQPVFVKAAGWEIQILRLDEVNGQAVINPDRRYQEFGHVKKATKVRDGLFVTQWTGFGPLGDVTGASKHEAIELLLEKHGFYEAEENATIPPLF